MEYFLAIGKPLTALSRQDNGESVTSIEVNESDVIPRRMKGGRPVGEATEARRNHEMLKLKECIGMLKDPERGLVQNILELKFSSSVAKSAVSSDGVRQEPSTSRNESPWIVKVEMSGHAIKELYSAFGEDIKFCLGLKFPNCHRTAKLAPTDDFFNKSSWMTFDAQSEFKDSCEGFIDLPMMLKKAWLEGQDLGAKLLIIVSLGSTVEQSAEQVVALTKQILDGEIGSDVQIICGGGNRIHCHRSFLIAQSEVLKSMLLSDMKESRSKEVCMDDMTFEGVKAFLAYLYYRGLDDAEWKCEIAVELIKAANKYMIESLERTMKEILTKKPLAWFEVDATLTLFFFASKVDGHEDLKAKAIRVLKARPMEVKSSALLNQIFQEDAAAAKEIFDALLG